jgi:hypothetical protein
MINPKSAFTRSRLRRTFSSLFFVAAAVAALGVIAFSRGWARTDILAFAGPTPPPCPPAFCQPASLFEYFDNVSPPALPPGWLATNAQGPPPLWVTSDSGVPMPPADTPPNAAFIDDPGVVSDKRLDSRNLAVFEGFVTRLTFRHNFKLEASNEDPNVGFDGGVLEYSTDGGNNFQYVAPASFVIGGYNRTISNDRGSPIAGLMAWSGNSGGFVTSVVNLELFGSDVRFRWRMASDTSGSSEGWRVDTVNVFGCRGDPSSCSPTPTPPPTPTPTPGALTLSASGRKVVGINTVRLTWSGATSNQIDVYRNAILIVTTENDDSYIDSTGDTGRARYTYRVCEAGTSTCSNAATVTFRH